VTEEETATEEESPAVEETATEEEPGMTGGFEAVDDEPSEVTEEGKSTEGELQ